jgi:hypothetical protein
MPTPWLRRIAVRVPDKFLDKTFFGRDEVSR